MVTRGRTFNTGAVSAASCSRPQVERDALIAATALVHGLTVATRDVAGFESAGVALINPWES